MKIFMDIGMDRENESRKDFVPSKILKKGYEKDISMWNEYSSYIMMSSHDFTKSISCTSFECTG
jgi:hypothetical protein